jgi:putative sterol carrier protein
MPALFTPAFFDELVKRLNNDPDFKQKAGGVAATVLMVNLDTKESFLLNLNKGSAAWTPGNPESKADFTFLGDAATWLSNHKGEAPMEKLVMTGKLKFKGSIPKIMGLRSQLGVIDRIAQSVPLE